MKLEDAMFVINVFELASDFRLRSLENNTEAKKESQHIADRYSELKLLGFGFSESSKRAKAEFLIRFTAQ